MKSIKILIIMILTAMPIFSQTGMPSITVTEAEKDFTLPISRAKVDVKIVGSLAITTFDIHFYNPYESTLEGQLDFPLADGVLVSRFALDVNKKLREGVIVEKAKGRVTYEDIVNRRVDPGLLEVTRGNNFRSRVYPLLPKQEKHIVIAYEEELKVTPDGLRYSLPLDMPNVLDIFSFKATVYSDFAVPFNTSNDDSKFVQKAGVYTRFSKYINYKAKDLFEFVIPFVGEQSVKFETYNNEDFFRISLNPEMKLQEKEKPQTISILWDISASRLNSDIKKELELLEEYMEYNKCNVELVPFSLYADEPSYFPKADFDELEANINGLRIDGATNYSSVDVSKLRGDEIFIFSDGIDNIGAGGFGETEKPMYVINSSSISDHDVCRKLAQKTGGKYINLLDNELSKALNLLTHNFPRFLGIDGAASDVYPINKVVDGKIDISGKLQAKSKLKLKFGYGNKVTKTIPINITEANSTNSGILHKIWAKQKLSYLNLDQAQNEKEITELAKKYSLVTAFTSLIVLETARDYYLYKITPPEELRAEYDSLIQYEKQMGWDSKNRSQDLLSQSKELKSILMKSLKELKEWYSFDYHKIINIDSCLKQLDNKIIDILEDLSKKERNEAYSVVDLKEYFPDIDFQYLNRIYVTTNSDKQMDWIKTFGDIGEFSYVISNETEDKPASKLINKLPNGQNYSNIQTYNLSTFAVREEIKYIQLVFKVNSSFGDSLNEKYRNKSDIKLLGRQLVLDIAMKDVDSYYNKLYVVNDLSTFISDSARKALEEQRARYETRKLFDKCEFSATNQIPFQKEGYGAIIGKITDKFGKPLAGATVILKGTKRGAKSKENGKFLFSNIDPDVYDLKFTYIGKETLNCEDIEVFSDSITFYNVKLKDNNTSSHCVSIIAERNNKTKYDIRNDIENKEEIESKEVFGSMRAYSISAPVTPVNNGNTMAMYALTLEESSADGFADAVSNLSASESSQSEVKTVEYQSSKEYYQKLNMVALAELETTYFKLRKDNERNPSFFFDAAKVFEKHGKIKEACRVVSNLAEINLEDHENLRRVAGFLMKNKEYKLAKSIYQHILKIRVEEPQSFRDYALCLAEMGEFQAAADSLYSLFTRDIPVDFKGMISTLVTEFNTLLLQHKDQIDISKYDPDYIFETPVDLRIEITWVMDETDIDLWVIEPDGTKCYYAQQFTKIGGFLSEDMIRGYGPEVYMIKKALAGKYKIKADYFSNRRQKSSIDPQIRCKIYTNYGRPNQKVQETIGKIEELSGEIDLGEVVID